MKSTDKYSHYCLPAGRFDNSVLLERQQCAQDLLNFIGQRSYLIKSKHFKEFFEVCKIIRYRIVCDTYSGIM